jgi:DNA repair exonuclease SbcCD ATPase subunit
MNAEAGSDAALREQLQQKLAELASLQSQLASANGVKKELETNLTGSKARIKELEDLLAKANKGPPAAVGADPAELKKVTKERDELREKLKEYEIIEDDLANLKRLQQENAQLKKALSGKEPETAAPISGGSDPLAGSADLFEEVAAPAPAENATEELEQFLSNGSEGAAAPEVAAAAEPEAPKAGAQNEKTPEDLLSEFEKMLG